MQNYTHYMCICVCICVFSITFLCVNAYITVARIICFSSSALDEAWNFIKTALKTGMDTHSLCLSHTHTPLLFITVHTPMYLPCAWDLLAKVLLFLPLSFLNLSNHLK